MDFAFTAFWESIRAKFRWHANEFGIRRPVLLNAFRLPLTVVDAFGTPGDTLLTGIVCHELKSRYPRIELHCVTPNPTLLEHNPDIDVLNGPETFFSIQFWYLDLIARKDGTTNLLQPTLAKLGIADYAYQPYLHLTSDELATAKNRLSPGTRRPIVTINVMSREQVKVWPVDFWNALLPDLRKLATVVHIGDATEPEFEDVIRMAGELSMRESAAVIAQADLHIGCVSFLMHAARSVNTPSVIIYGGRETPQTSGYPENINLQTKLDCSPCWLQNSRGDRCPHDMKCMHLISPDQVLQAIKRSLGVVAS